MAKIIPRSPAISFLSVCTVVFVTLAEQVLAAEYYVKPLTVSGSFQSVGTIPRLNSRGDVIASLYDIVVQDTVSVRWSERSAVGVRIEQTAGSDSVALGIADDGTFVGWGYGFRTVNPLITDRVATVGGFQVSPSGSVDFVWRPEGSLNQPQAINNRHVIASVETGSVLKVTGPGVDRSYSFGNNFSAASINSKDKVVGFVVTDDRQDRTALFTYDADGVVTQYPKLLGRETVRGTDINESDVVSGWALPAQIQRNTPEGSLPILAFTMKNGEFTFLPSLYNEGGAAANALNDFGVVVGQSDGPGYWGSAATIWRDGVPADLNTLVDGLPEGYSLFYATDVNNNGDIVALGLGPLGGFSPFLLTPIPDPHLAGATFLLSFGPVACRSRRNRRLPSKPGL